MVAVAPKSVSGVGWVGSELPPPRVAMLTMTSAAAMARAAPIAPTYSVRVCSRNVRFDCAGDVVRTMRVGFFRFAMAETMPAE